MAIDWLLISYRAPTNPSSARVAIWRSLHRLGALYLGPSVCAIPTPAISRDALTTIGDRLVAAAGAFQVLEVTSLSPGSDADLRERYNAARDAEYDEVIERAEALIAELEREGATGKFTFAEVEENDGGLVKLRRWLRSIYRRDVFSAPRRRTAEEAIRRAEVCLQRFVEVAMERETGPVEPAGDEGGVC